MNEKLLKKLYSINSPSGKETDMENFVIEAEYKQRYWNYDEYNEKYVEEDVIACQIWNGSEYVEKYVSENYASEMFEEVDGVYYNEVFKEEVLG